MCGHWISASTEMMEIRSRSIQKRSDHDGHGEHGGKYFSTTTGVATSPQGAGQPEADLAKRDATTPHRGGNLSGAFPTQAMPVPFFRHSRESGNPVPCLQAEGLQIQIQRMRRHAPDGTPWIPAFAGMTGMFRHLTSVYAGIAGIFLLFIQKRFNSFQTLPWIPADKGTTGFSLVFRRVRRG
ncbi:MAG: hypothetical protein LBI87_01575 [Candidatus Accumulibacter sp.]|jgi:hypothetical protein|nr:hypothetical protein [Accumulibacter sp.]